MKREYYRLTKIRWYGDFWVKPGGIIIKCYTQEEVDHMYLHCGKRYEKLFLTSNQ